MLFTAFWPPYIFTHDNRSFCSFCCGSFFSFTSIYNAPCFFLSLLPAGGRGNVSVVNGRRMAGDEKHGDSEHTAALHIAAPVIYEDAESFLWPDWPDLLVTSRQWLVRKIASLA